MFAQDGLTWGQVRRLYAERPPRPELDGSIAPDDFLATVIQRFLSSGTAIGEVVRAMPELYSAAGPAKDLPSRDTLRALTDDVIGMAASSVPPQQLRSLAPGGILSDGELEYLRILRAVLLGAAQVPVAHEMNRRLPLLFRPPADRPTATVEQVIRIDEFDPSDFDLYGAAMTEFMCRLYDFFRDASERSLPHGDRPDVPHLAATRFAQAANARYNAGYGPDHRGFRFPTMRPLSNVDPGEALCLNWIDGSHTYGVYATAVMQLAARDPIARSRGADVQSVPGLQRVLATNLPIVQAMGLHGTRGVNTNIGRRQGTPGRRWTPPSELFVVQDHDSDGFPLLDFKPDTAFDRLRAHEFHGGCTGARGVVDGSTLVEWNGLIGALFVAPLAKQVLSVELSQEQRGNPAGLPGLV